MVILLVMLPLWLVLSSGAGLFLWWRGERSQSSREPAKFATPVDASRLADDVRKLVEVVGERHARSESGAYGLTRAAAMIEGALGAANAGYRVRSVAGPATEAGSWPVVLASLPGGPGRALWLVAGYDSRPGSPGAEANASGVASMIAVAQALAAEPVVRPVTFAFVPHAHDPDGLQAPLVGQLAGMAEQAELVVVVEAMGDGDTLQISSRDALAVTRPPFAAHGTVVGAGTICLTDDSDLSARFFEAGLPAVRVATRGVVRADEPDRTLPDMARHAAATARLAELVRALAAGP